MQKVKRIFISGPVTGIRNYYENFNKAAMELESKFPFAQIVNPVAVCGEDVETLYHYDGEQLCEQCVLKRLEIVTD